MLVRAIESAEFLCAIEGWKGYIIFTGPGGAPHICPLTNKKRIEKAESIIVVVRRKRK